jgi:glutaredoxin
MSIQQDVDRGLEIVEEIELLKEELKKIEGRLTASGLKGDQVPLEDEDREGRQWIAKGSDKQVPVIFTADAIIGGFADDSPAHLKIKAAAGSSLKEFFKITWKNRIEDGKKFRARATELLADKAPQFITACLARDKEGMPKSKIVVAWHETKEKA